MSVYDRRENIMPDNTAYQCPNCTGPLHFNAHLGKLSCDYCLSEFDNEEIKKLYEGKNVAAAAQEKTEREWGEDADRMAAYNCSTCGAELICEKETAATSCPYCGNPTIIPGQFKGADKPDYCIPFRHEKKDAVECLKKYYKGRLLLPKSFVSENHINEIQGVYVPFWLFSGTASGSGVYDAVHESRHRRGNDEVITEKHYEVIREGSLDFDKIPVDASVKMDDALMDSIEPFNYAELKPFALEYLPGFLANKYDVSKDDSIPRARERANKSFEETLKSSVKGFDSVSTKSHDENFQGSKIEYGMLPVWLLNTKWSGKDFVFAMNGQTGKMTGNLPISSGKFAAWIIGTLFVSLFLLNFIMSDLLIAFFGAAILTVIVSIVLYSSMKPVAIASNASSYVAKNGLKLSVSRERYTHTSERVIHHEKRKS